MTPKRYILHNFNLRVASNRFSAISQIRETDRVYVHKYIPDQRFSEHDWRQYDRHTGIYAQIFLMLHFEIFR